MTVADIIEKPVHWFAEQMDWFLYDIGLRRERINEFIEQASQIT